MIQPKFKKHELLLNVQGVYDRPGRFGTYRFGLYMVTLAYFGLEILRDMFSKHASSSADYSCAIGCLFFITSETMCSRFEWVVSIQH